MKNTDIVINQNPIQSRKLLAKEAAHLFGFKLHCHIPMNLVLEDHLMSKENNFYKNLFCYSFSPKSNTKLGIISSNNAIDINYCVQTDSGYEHSLELLTLKIENALQNNIKDLRLKNSKWELTFNKEYRRKINQQRSLLSELKRLEETYDHSVAVESIRDDNPLLIVKDDDFVCNIPDIDFNKIELYSIRLNHLNAIDNGASLFEKTVYKVDTFEIDKNKRDSDVFINLSFLSTDGNKRRLPAKIIFNSEKDIWEIKLSNNHKSKNHKNIGFFFKEEDIKKYTNDFKRKLFDQEIMFDF